MLMVYRSIHNPVTSTALKSTGFTDQRDHQEIGLLMIVLDLVNIKCSIVNDRGDSTILSHTCNDVRWPCDTIAERGDYRLSTLEVSTTHATARAAGNTLRWTHAHTGAPRGPAATMNQATGQAEADIAVGIA